jgi:hypothetical protein
MQGQGAYAQGLTAAVNFTIMYVMTLFEDDRYNWRETYFVYFESPNRPKLSPVRRALKTHAPLLNINDIKADSYGNLLSMTLASYEDHAALEIVSREGNEVLSDVRHLVHTLKEEASADDISQLQRIALCTMRLDIHHFEQTAGTKVFNITKFPEIKFAKQSTQPAEHGDIFLKALGQDRASRERFHFDPDSYDRCRGSTASKESDVAGEAGMGKEEESERINPETLVTILEILRQVSQGIIFDPASGIIL